MDDYFTDIEGLPLYLDLEKGNPHRDPSVGQYISGGKSKSKEGMYDLSDAVMALLDQLPGEDMKKDEQY